MDGAGAFKIESLGDNIRVFPKEAGDSPCIVTLKWISIRILSFALSAGWLALGVLRADYLSRHRH